jgi:hypothetical protein
MNYNKPDAYLSINQPGPEITAAQNKNRPRTVGFAIGSTLSKQPFTDSASRPPSIYCIPDKVLYFQANRGFYHGN